MTDAHHNCILSLAPYVGDLKNSSLGWFQILSSGYFTFGSFWWIYFGLFISSPWLTMSGAIVFVLVMCILNCQLIDISNNRLPLT